MAFAPQFRLKRNGSVILTWSPPYGGVNAVPGSPDFTPGGTSMRTILDAPGGAAVYSLEVFRDGTSGGGSATVIGHRALLVQSVRR